MLICDNYQQHDYGGYGGDKIPGVATGANIHSRMHAQRLYEHDTEDQDRLCTKTVDGSNTNLVNQETYLHLCPGSRWGEGQ